MRAVFVERHGGSDALRIGERPDAPAPERGEVRVRLRAAALNHLDLFVRDGIPGVTLSLPVTAGADGAGEVESCGSDVADLSPGRRVLLQPGLYCNTCEFCRAGEQCLCIRFQILGEHRDGTFADFVTVPTRNVFPIPDALSFADAAAFSLSYQTAWRMVVSRGAIRPGQTMLIHGVGGGVGWAALQIGLLSGARVFVTSGSEAKLAEARSIGAEQAWSSRTEDIPKAVAGATGKRGCDLVIDSVGDKTWLSSLRAVARGGRVVTCGATTGPNPQEEIRLIFWKHISILGSTMANDREFRAMLSAVFSGKLVPRVDSVFPLDRAREAYARMESGEQLGKIVLTLS